MTTPAQDAADPLLIAELRRDEGEVLSAYRDSLGFLTIGVGRLIDPRKGGGVTRAESAVLLSNDIADKSAALQAALPWIETLDPVRRRVLINMAFNLGVEGLLGFRNTLAAVQHGDFAGAAAGIVASKAARQTGARYARLSVAMRTGAV